MYGTVRKCYATGEVTGEIDSQSLGGFLGFWWAGEREQFRASHVITFLSALTLTLLLLVFFILFLFFLIHRGTLE